MKRFEMGPEVASKVGLGIVELEGTVVLSTNPRWSEIEDFGRSLRERHGTTAIGKVEGVEDARTLYRSIGVDPTKTRPSSEALLRRALKGEPLHQVNTLVDAMNLASLTFLLPLGLYDAAKIEGDTVFVRHGKEGEMYAGIRKGEVHLAGRFCLADLVGPFGSPSSDSARTSVTTATTSGLVVVFAPEGYSRARMEQNLDRIATLAARFTSAQAVGRGLVGLG